MRMTNLGIMPRGLIQRVTPPALWAVAVAVAMLLPIGASPAVAAAAPVKADLTFDEISSEVTRALDPTADPCQDFYQYACGGWLKTEKKPEDRARWSRSFSVIDERNRAIIRDILDDAAKNPGDDADRRRVGTYYGSCMAEPAIEKAGVRPLQGWFAEIDRVRDTKSLLATAGKMHLQIPGGAPLLGFGVFPDFKNPDTDIVFMAQGGLGLPERDYYLSNEADKKNLRAEYEKHVAEMLALSGVGKGAAASQAKAILGFETELAKASRPVEQMRELDKMYNKLDLQGLLKLTPSLPWDVFYSAAGATGEIPINVGTPEFFTRLEELVKATPVSILRAYLRWQTLAATSPHLSKKFVDANFRFFGQKLAGQPKLEERWKRCVAATENALGFSLGKVYVDRTFPGESKAKALEMIGDIEEAFEQALPDLDWMDDATRWRALQKKNAVGNKIGYPDVWRDYSSMRLSAGDYYANVAAAGEFEARRVAAKIGRPVDKSEWGMVPQMVNAYYNPLGNEIAFPAGILQPPFFHKDFPAAMNYGAIGMVIGHELSHAFDDSGRKFDAKGQMTEWWAPEVSAKFEKEADCLRDQYSKFEVEPGLFLNGKLTAGENIADNGGLKQAWVAYELWKKRHPAAQPTVAGLNDKQLFFVAHAQGWCTLATPENDRLRVATDPHSLPRQRVNGPAVNHPAFAEVFQCRPGSPMNPPAEQKCAVW